MTADDTPDIVERLMRDALPWIDRAYAKPADPEETPFYFTRHNMEVACRWGIETALRAAQPPQARDEGGAVEGWVMVPREPTEAMAEAGSPNIPMSDHGAMIAAAGCWKDMLAAAPPSPPTDAINDDWNLR